MAQIRDERTKQVAVGLGVIFAVTVLVCAALVGWRWVPGWVGEWLGMMIGIMTTPFFMEASFVILGLVIVVTLNGWRRKRSGEELVYLEEVSGPDVPEGLPDAAKWAIYGEKPLAGEIPSLREQAEGAVAIGDFDQAAECIAAMEPEEMRLPETLVLRVALAKACGKHDLAALLEAELDALHASSR